MHHFARYSSSPFPLLAAVGARIRTIEIATGVIDMRYENPHYLPKDAAAEDLISGGRLQLGIRRGSPEQVIKRWRHFGYSPALGEDDAAMGRRHAEEYIEILNENGFATDKPAANVCEAARFAASRAIFRERIRRDAGSDPTAVWAAQLGMN